MLSLCLQRHCQEMLASNASGHHRGSNCPKWRTYTCGAIVGQAYGILQQAHKVAQLAVPAQT